ncbi:MAG: phospho-N-acetylmuramoyl-pentapeptide-transferase [Clostridia bacterium]|nr:phospho-N-acetylmuramoyl-pentapeptide-transferase [Clostridia bacterium]
MTQALYSFLIGFFLCVLLAPLIIKLINKLKGGQPILNYVEAHVNKSGTPTMGGIIFLVGAVVCFLCFVNANNQLALVSLACMLSYGLLGFLDDFIKVKFKHNLGLKAYQKVIGQVGLAVLMGVFIYLNTFVGSGVLIPFTNLEVNFGWGIIPFVVFVFLATTNAVNLTDGLDGLAGGVSFVFFVGFLIILNNHILGLEYAGENPALIAELKSVLSLVGGVAGSLLAFLCFNCHPAKVFMGDTGSLALGGFVAAICSVTKMYLLVPIMGLMFVLSAVSVIVQVLYFKATKKRIFLMAPLHHHFEKKGCYETKIVAIYIIITLVLCATVIALWN